MARINLLPWREIERARQQREFFIMIGGGVIVTVLAVFAVHMHISGLITAQSQRNLMLDKEIAIMDQKIEEIKDLESTKARLLARMDIIQQLQSSRPQIVHLFDELVATLPVGVYLTKVEQKGGSVSMAGRAQSNARVSAFMRNIASSDWLESANLKVIKNKNKTGTGLSHFELVATQVIPSDEVKK
jgi:type IV pilus assembly protein PilN